MGFSDTSDEHHKWTDNLTKFEAMMIFLLVVALICTAGVLFVTVRFFKSFGARDRLFSVFLILLNLALVGRILFLISSISEHWPGTWRTALNWRSGFSSYLGTMFLSMAGIANMFIWIYFILSIKTYILQNKKFKKRWRKITGYLIVPFILAVPVLYSVGLIWGWALPEHKDYDADKEAYEPVQRYMFIVGSTIFGMLGIAFIWTGIWLKRELRQYNEDYEARIKWKLIFSTCILSLPFLIRCAYNVIGAIIHIDSHIMRPSIEKNTWVAPIIYTVYIVIADLLPITSQLISMLVVVDDISSESYASTFIDKKSITTEDDWSFLNGDNDIQKLQVSANLSSTPNLLEGMQNKFWSTSTKGE